MKDKSPAEQLDPAKILSPGRLRCPCDERTTVTRESIPNGFVRAACTGVGCSWSQTVAGQVSARVMPAPRVVVVEVEIPVVAVVEVREPTPADLGIHCRIPRCKHTVTTTLGKQAGFCLKHLSRYVHAGCPEGSAMQLFIEIIQEAKL